jgi:L-ascorbate metabolism protein UlaG (beta-lactamase superfamily)
MKITWNGHSQIELRKGKARALLNPDKKVDAGSAQVVVFDTTDANHKGPKEGLLVDWPGEYGTEHFSFRGIEYEGKKGPQMAYTFTTREGNVAWMGEMAEYPSEEFIKSLGEVHVLLVPVGGGERLDGKKAFRLVEALEPLVVIPICFDKKDGLGAFLKEMDVKHPEPQKSHEMKRSALGGDQMELVILEEG